MVIFRLAKKILEDFLRAEMIIIMRNQNHYNKGYQKKNYK